MKRNITILILFSLLSSLLACNTTKKETPKELTGALLWEISGNGLKQSSYVLGSFHVVSYSDIEKKINGLQPAFSSSNVVVGEINMIDLSNQMNEMVTAMAMPNDTTYQELLSEEDYNFLDQFLKDNLGAGLLQYGLIKPVALSTILTLDMYSKVMGDKLPNTADGMDSYFQTEGIKNNKTVKGLETMKEQIDVLYFSNSLQQQADDLICMIKNKEYNKESIKKLIEIYYNCDLKGLYELSTDKNTPCPFNEEFEMRLLKDRNDNWMKKLPAMLSEDSNFIVVGALHLCGEDGLLQQLVNKGYTVSPIK